MRREDALSCRALPCVLATLPLTVGAQQAAAVDPPPARWSQQLGLRGADWDVEAFAVFDDGSGPALYAVGRFDSVGKAGAEGLARWAGDDWEAVPTPWTSASLLDACVFDDGSGPRLFFAGSFQIAGTGYAVGAWDGTTWTGWSVTPFKTRIEASTLYTDGAFLYLGGRFGSVDGVAAQNVARFDGTSWSAMGTGLPWNVEALLESDATGPTRLYAGIRTGGFPSTPTLWSWAGEGWNVVPGIVGAHVWDLAEHDDALLVGGEAPLMKLDAEGLRLFSEPAPAVVYELLVRDEAGQPTLYAAGDFISVGAVTCNNVARWSGAAWEALDAGVVAPGFLWGKALASYDLGQGSRLLLGGRFDRANGDVIHNVASWDGARWNRVGGDQGVDGEVRAYAVFDDGAGERLYAAGLFWEAGSVGAYSLVRWNQGAWEAVPGNPFTSAASVLSMYVWDDGSGPALYFTGYLPGLSGLTRWDGTSWTPIPSGSAILDLVGWDDGAGPALFAGGTFNGMGPAGTAHMAKWDGATWVSLGVFNDDVHSLAIFDDGAGERLYAGGRFTSIDGNPFSGLASWDGLAWSPVGGGVSAPSNVGDLLTVDLPVLGGRRLVISGGFSAFGPGSTPTDGLVTWDGGQLQDLSPYQPGATVYGRRLAVWDDGSGPALVATHHTSATFQLAALGAAGWRALGPAGRGDVSVLFPARLRSRPPALWVGGDIHNVGPIGSRGVARLSPRLGKLPLELETR